MEAVRWLRTDPLGLVGGFWHIRLIADLLLTEFVERRHADWYPRRKR